MVGSDWRILGRSDYNMKICTLPFPKTPFLGKGTLLVKFTFTNIDIFGSLHNIL